MKIIPLLSPPRSRFLKAAKVILSPGEYVGEHTTGKKEEIIIVLRGEGILLRGKEEVRVKEGDIHYVKENTRHNIRNTSGRKLEYVYIVNSLQPPV
ncbi:MAG: cupin domain-containing protein [Candidatus Aenigmarchaeota archaeon]|nr:cupin domain-containing protein [Candidatus Aenigmarchaeota archaeon]